MLSDQELIEDCKAEDDSKRSSGFSSVIMLLLVLSSGFLSVIMLLLLCTYVLVPWILFFCSSVIVRHHNTHAHTS